MYPYPFISKYTIYINICILSETLKVRTLRNISKKNNHRLFQISRKLALLATVLAASTILACIKTKETPDDLIVESTASTVPLISTVTPQRRMSRVERKTIFIDITNSAGVRFKHNQVEKEVQPIGAGVLVFDYNNDDLEDIYVTNSIGPNALFRNNGNGTFTDTAAAAGIDDPSGHSNGGCAADYDNDGDKDLYLTNYGTSKIFSNNGDGTFRDLTTTVGLGDSDKNLRSAGCAWGDYDRDGFLDLIVVRHLKELAPDTLVSGDFYLAVGMLALYHANGDGTFTEVTEILGDTRIREKNLYGEAIGNLWGAGFQPGWFDYDEDGDPDLYIVNDWGPNVQPNVLWRNDGPARDGQWIFSDISKQSGAGVPMYGMSLAVGDYDLDGHLDMFMTNIGATVLLKNNGDGTSFTDMAGEANVEVAKIGTEDRVTWGSVFFDYDNDGFEDLYIVSGYLSLPGVEDVPQYLKEQHNILLRNKGDGTFTNLSAVSGADDPGVGRGLGYLDIENDGCLDLFIGNLGGYTSLYKNRCEEPNNWLVVKAVGTESNRDGIGARITVNSGGKSQVREIASGRSFMGHHMIPVHFGLGNADKIDEIIVKWPSGKVQTVSTVAINNRITIIEPG